MKIKALSSRKGWTQQTHNPEIGRKIGRKTEFWAPFKRLFEFLRSEIEATWPLVLPEIVDGLFGVS